ncbi:hypothetical protein BT96DRAFT_1016856 [Gymnopus androsaceus JB14]|uniref:F-box domain-containing protein n=1 Tax=Gymnopus androsaceus JB14 TaxID=1447944 RepID=A0A6A4I386_9AGAR|nr:hypothetical protein BT96DRAFT_1016856 [Gymnopus androsaceus JB14]
MVLPNELVEPILENLYSDKSTLLNCALVGRAWAPASQRGIFQQIVLRLPFPQADKDFATVADAYLKANGRLVEILDENSRLVFYVRRLELREFVIWDSEDLVAYEPIHNSTAELILRLSSVEELSFEQVRWDPLPPMLKEALTNMLKAPQLTGISLGLIVSDKFADVVSLLSHATNLKVLKLEVVRCSNWDITPRTDNVATRSIQLDRLVLKLEDTPFTTFSLADWLQQKSCPFEVRHLLSLRIQYSANLDYHRAASMLDYVGDSLRELQLVTGNPMQAEALNVLHLGHTSNLHILKLFRVMQDDSYTPVPWIQSLFKPFIESGRRCPLQHLTIELLVGHSDALETPQWEQWVALDKLFKKPQFASLESVNVIMVGMNPMPNGVVESLSGKLLFLKQSRKLKATFRLLTGMTDTMVY